MIEVKRPKAHYQDIHVQPRPNHFCQSHEGNVGQYH